MAPRARVRGAPRPRCCPRDPHHQHSDTRQDKKEGKDTKSGQAPKTTTAKLKERWLLTRKTWRYMSDAGKKLFPEGVNPQKAEDIPKVEEHFQKINSRSRDFILVPKPPESPRSGRRRRKRLMSTASDTTDTADDYLDTDDEGGPRSAPVHGLECMKGAFLGHSLAMGGTPLMGAMGTAGVLGAMGTALPMGAHVGVPGSMKGAGPSGQCGAGATQGGGLPTSGYPGLPITAGLSRERLLSVGELRYELPPEVYHHLLRSNLLQWSQQDLTEEDEDEYDSGEQLEIDGSRMRSVGAQTDPHLDMSVQTDDDATAEDMVKVPETPPALESSGSGTSMLKKLWQRRESAAGGVIKGEALQQEGGAKKQASEKDKEAPPPKGVVAAKRMWAEKAAASGGTPITPPGTKPKQEKAQEKSKLKSVFKLGLKCDVDQQGGSSKKSVEKTKVGDPLPQFILAGFRISSPVEIIHQRRRSRRRVSKADSSDFSGSECSMPTSPRYSVTVTDDQGSRDLLVSEAEAFRLCQMGVHITFKRSSIDASVDTSEFEAEGAAGGFPPFQRSISALQASGHLSQMMYNIRGRPSHPQVNPCAGAAPGQGGHRGSQGLLQSFLPAVMQRSRASGSGHTSRLVAKKIWRARSKSQSRASAGTTSIWTPMVSTSSCSFCA
ncbi:hypothetical protein C7M84_011088 [Penaeus vannamei]|uniref:Uncharacterized protein n=1 Tax=Penaeus vannamei TaxID=6689 RepID=A0A423T2B1_PENVA|nr:hypothetical protein C7M84_011088 [Penaeus vannamei]